MNKLLFICAFLVLSSTAKALDAQKKGDWISVGAPESFHQGTEGVLYLHGDNHGACAGVTPSYIRLNMDHSHFKEFYSLLLYTAAQKQSLDCVVDGGCGGNEVWVKYCRGKF